MGNSAARCAAPKSPLAPPFDWAQDMLFQRGGIRTIRQNSPFDKGGRRGIFIADNE
jgi:hypothetical protein